MKLITVGELRKQLGRIPDSRVIIVSGDDHEYAALVAAKSTSVLIDGKGVITEDYGEALTPSSVYGQRQEALELVFHQKKG